MGRKRDRARLQVAGVVSNPKRQPITVQGAPEVGETGGPAPGAQVQSTAGKWQNGPHLGGGGGRLSIWSSEISCRANLMTPAELRCIRLPHSPAWVTFPSKTSESLAPLGAGLSSHRKKTMYCNRHTFRTLQMSPAGENAPLALSRRKKGQGHHVSATFLREGENRHRLTVLQQWECRRSIERERQRQTLESRILAPLYYNTKESGCRRNDTGDEHRQSHAWRHGLHRLQGVSECRGLCTCMWGCGACAVRR